jgi:hypothetical protein
MGRSWSGRSSPPPRYPVLAMATRKVNLMLDEELVRRARQQDACVGKSDVQVVEDALAVDLGLRALQDARVEHSQR